MSTADPLLDTTIPARSLTSRQFGQAVLLSLVAVTAGCVLYGVETGVLRCRHRFIENPTEVMVRGLGLAHFLVGWLFLISSPKLRSIGGLGRLAGWAMVGGLLGLGYYQGGGGKNPWTVLGFYGLFLVHEIHDQAELFLARGDAAPIPGQEKVLRWLCLAAGQWLLVLLLGSSLLQTLLFRDPSALRNVSPALVAIGLGLLVVGGFASSLLFLQRGRRVYGSYHQTRAALEPLLMVYFVLGGILALGCFLGSGAFNFIILVHVMTWLIFVQHRLPPASAWSGWWPWLRRTRSGFLTLHLVIALAILVLLALRVHVWQRSGLFSLLLSGSSFPCWSLLHITMSCARRP